MLVFLRFGFCFFIGFFGGVLFGSGFFPGLLLGRRRFAFPVYQLDERHGSVIPQPVADFDDARVAAVALGVPLGQRAEQFEKRVLFDDHFASQTFGMQGSLFSEGDGFFHVAPQLLGFSEGGADPFPSDQGGNHVPEQRFAMSRGPTQFSA